MGAHIRPLEPIADESRGSHPVPVPPIETEGVGLLRETELSSIEARYADGLTSAQIVDFFSRRGFRISEATFRKYVQLNLLPRSRRVGRKGKHQGSRGLYPASTIRRLNAIRRLMGAGRTIEEIQRTFGRFHDDIEALEQGLQTLFTGFERAIQGSQFDARRRRSLAAEVANARHDAQQLLRTLGSLEHAFAPTEAAEGPAGLTPAAETIDDDLV